MEKQTKNTKAMMPIGQLISKSFGIYETLGWKIIGMVVLPALIAAIPLILVVVIYLVITGINPEPNSGMMVSNIILGFLGIIATLFLAAVSFLANIGAMILVRDNNPKLKIIDALKASTKYGWAFLGVTLLVMLFTVLGFVLFIVPGIMVAIYLLFVGWVVVNEKLSGIKALKRSKELVKGYWWRVFGRQFLVSFVIWLIFVIPAAMVEPDTPAENLYDFLSQVASWIITPFSLAFSYNMYKDLLRIKGPAKN